MFRRKRQISPGRTSMRLAFGFHDRKTPDVEDIIANEVHPSIGSHS